MTVAELSSRIGMRELEEWAALARVDKDEADRVKLKTQVKSNIHSVRSQFRKQA